MTDYKILRPGTGLVIDGVRTPLPEVNVVNFLDAPELAMSQADGETRKPEEPIYLAVLHTTTGRMPQRLVPGAGPAGDLAERTARSWSNSERVASAHLIVDWDGQIVQIADLAQKITYHAGHREVNHRSVGIELAIASDGRLWEVQMEALMALLACLTRHPRFAIGRVYAKGDWPMAGIADFRGIISHRDVGNRGEGDCGPVPYQYLDKHGYTPIAFPGPAMAAYWRGVQTQANALLAARDPLKVDGDPGPKTFAALRHLRAVLPDYDATGLP